MTFEEWCEKVAELIITQKPQNLNADDMYIKSCYQVKMSPQEFINNANKEIN